VAVVGNRYADLSRLPQGSNGHGHGAMAWPDHMNGGLEKLVQGPGNAIQIQGDPHWFFRKISNDVNMFFAEKTSKFIQNLVYDRSQVFLNKRRFVVVAVIDNRL
jgi:hypothetical protein